MRVWLAGVAIAAAMPLWAGEHAVLATGFSMRIDRHEVQGDRVRLYIGSGFTEVAATDVVRFEPEFVAPATAAPAAPAPEAKQANSAEVLIQDAAKRYGLPHAFLRSVANAESGLRQDAVSPKGAVGIMQLMPETARALGADPADPRQNVEAGTRFLAELLLKYKDDPYQVHKALAAYNAGPGAVDRYRGIPPYRETVKYIEKVIRQAGL